MEKNNKGFTIVELGVSICLVTLVSFLLFQMITNVKKIYTTGDIKTELMTRQAIIIKKIYDELDSKTLISINDCINDEDTQKNILQTSCLKFRFSDGTANTFVVDPIKHSITYGNYSINYETIDDTISFGELTYNHQYNDFFTIKVPITSNTVKGNYDIQITYQPDIPVAHNYTGTFNEITVPIITDGQVTTTTIQKEGGSYWLKIYDANDTVLNNFMSTHLKYLKHETCSNVAMVGKIYELKTSTNSSRWCQTNNMYTQKIGEYQNVSGYSFTALGKNTYVEALTASSYVADTKALLKVDNFIDKYTFKEHLE